MPNCCSSTRSGPISTATRCARRSPTMRGANGATEAYERRRRPDPDIRPADPLRRRRGDDRGRGRRHLARRLAVPHPGRRRGRGHDHRMGRHAPRRAALGLCWPPACWSPSLLGGGGISLSGGAGPARVRRRGARAQLAGLRRHRRARSPASAPRAAASRWAGASSTSPAELRPAQPLLGLGNARLLGVRRHLGDRHLRLFRRPRDRRAEARAADQPEQDLGRPDRRHGRRRRRSAG